MKSAIAVRFSVAPWAVTWTAPSVFRTTTMFVSTEPFAFAVTVATRFPATSIRTVSLGAHPGPEVTSTVVPLGP